MKRAVLSSRLSVLALAAAELAAASPVLAQAAASPLSAQTAAPAGQAGEESDNQRTVSFADLNAGAGYSNSPLLQSRSGSSAFARLSITGYHAWNGERGSTSVSAFLENTTYLGGGYGSKQIFRVNGQTNRAVSEKLSVFGDVGISGDAAGQLTNRFTGPIIAPPPDTNPLPDNNLDVINLSGRQYRVNGDAGASITTSARSSVSLTAGAAHVFFTGGNKVSDYTTIQGSIGYSHLLSERSSIGATVYLQREDFRGNDYSNVVNPTLTFRTQLAQDIVANGAIGVLAIYSYRLGQSDHTYSPSFTASVCKSGERTQYCANLSRSAQAPLSIGLAQNTGGTAITTNFNLTYAREIGRKETIRALVTATSSSRITVLDEGRFRTTYLTSLVSYDRKVGNRLFAGVSASARKLVQTGPDPRMDFNGSVYLRYRLGDLL
jgi:hypothetical protein